MAANGLIFQQLLEQESSTYTYLLADQASGEAVLIDPVKETLARDLQLLKDMNLKLKYVLDTHIHADHITAAGLLREETGAKTAVSAESEVECVDIPLNDGDELTFGSHKIKAIATPGHTNTCMSFLVGDKIFTGDALLIRGTGRTDFQSGSSEKLYQSITEKIFKLPDATYVYPGHDYRGFSWSTVGLEKKHNPRVGGGKTLSEFKKIMSELNLANPKKIHEAVPANLMCGKEKKERVLNPQLVNGINEISCEELKKNQQKVKLIDVRNPEEFNNEYGHIEGARLIPLGPEFDAYLKTANPNEEVVFICRSGGRSGNATKRAMDVGIKWSANMVGGMIRWNELKFPVKRD